MAKSLESDERLTQTGQQVGTLPYMSPEQISSAVGDVSTRTDVYALGVTLYELLTGELPFRANGLVELHRDILESEPRFSAVEGTRISLDLRTICLKCLEKQPEHRYASAGELAEDLSCYLAGRPIVARRIGPLQRTWRWWARNRAVGTLLIVLSVALIAGAATSGYLGSCSTPKRMKRFKKATWPSDNGRWRNKRPRKQTNGRWTWSGNYEQRAAALGGRRRKCPAREPGT